MIGSTMTGMTITGMTVTGDNDRNDSVRSDHDRSEYERNQILFLRLIFRTVHRKSQISELDSVLSTTRRNTKGNFSHGFPSEEVNFVFDLMKINNFSKRQQQ